MTTKQDIANAALDAIALLRCALRGDAESMSAMINTYAGPGRERECAELIIALAGQSRALCQLAAMLTGVAPEDVLNSTAAVIREDMAK